MLTRRSEEEINLCHQPLILEVAQGLVGYGAREDEEGRRRRVGGGGGVARKNTRDDHLHVDLFLMIGLSYRYPVKKPL